MTGHEQHKKNRLFCDLKTDEEKAAFFLSGRGYETGVIAHSIQNDVATAYQRCSEYRKEAEALQAELDALRRDAEIGKLVRLKMTSGNSVPVERCIITAAEIAAIAQQEPSHDNQ